MNCPYCVSQDTGVIESRDAEDGQVVRRRRQCEKCKKRFTTYERVGNIDLKVLKKDGLVEDFERDKLERGIRKACWKRPIGDEEIEHLVDEVEVKLLNRKTTEVPSTDIGKMVMTRLKKLDLVAYLRFASVYLDVETLGDFERVLKEAKELER